MECLNEEKFHEYIDGSLTNVEKAMVRDHLIVCDNCRSRYEAFDTIEKSLESPVLIQPPEIIERLVLKKLFPRVPGYASIFTFIAASFLLMVTGIYVWFDFANNSLIQAYQLTSNSTVNWLGTVVKTITTIISFLAAVFKAITKLTNVVFGVTVSPDLMGLGCLVVLLLGIYGISKLALRKSGQKI